MKNNSLFGSSCALLGLLAMPIASATTFVFDIDYSSPSITNSSVNGHAPACGSGSEDCNASLITTTQGGTTLSVTAGISNTNLHLRDGFDEFRYTAANVYWDGNSAHGGLGVEAGQDQTGCIGGSNSLQGSCAGWHLDEILFLDFGNQVNFMSAQFNGGDTDFLSASADFDIFIGDGHDNWTRIINDAAPRGPDLITIDAIGQYFAIVADDTLDAGYLEALTVQVPEPGMLALFGIGILGLGFASRRNI